MTNFERGFYADPDADHDTALVGPRRAVPAPHRPDGRHAPDWAAKIHVALAPVYYQNYLLGELVASQLQATLLDRFGGIVGRPDGGRLPADRVLRPRLVVPLGRADRARHRRAARRRRVRGRARRARDASAADRPADVRHARASSAPTGCSSRKNSDRPPDERQVVESFPPRPGRRHRRTQYLELPDTGAAAFVGSRPTWLWGVEHGVNEHGVAIGNEKIYTTGRPKARPAGAARHGPRPARARTRPLRRPRGRRRSPR